MILGLQIKIIFYSFIYGIFFYISLRLFKKITFKNKILKYFMQFIFCILNIFLFYFLLYKINYGILNYYELIFFFVGMFFCQSFYFNN